MSGSLGEVLAESERRTNRSCCQAALAVAAVFVLICHVGLTGAFGISYQWMYFYAGMIILPILAVVAYAKARDYRSPATKYLMIGVASLVPAGRYFSRRP